MASVPPVGRVIAVTGACTYLGSELLRRLEEDPRYTKVLALDIRPPALMPHSPASAGSLHSGPHSPPHSAASAGSFDSGHNGKIEFIKIDLTQPTVDGELATLLARYDVDTFVHGAFLSHPTHAAEWAHELEDVGTMHVLNACSGSKPRRFILISTTLVYGAHPKNPNFLVEEAELKGHRSNQAGRFVNDKVRAEHQVARFAAEHADVEVCVLRFAPILGPSISNMFTRFFSRVFAPVMMGHDPLIQFVHEQDAAFALLRAVESTATGVFNIVGKGVLPYTTVLALLGRVPIPMPQLVARPLLRLLWATQLTGAPPSFLDFLLYLCVADGAKARKELGFQARLSIKRTILDFGGIRPEDGATDVSRAHG